MLAMALTASNLDPSESYHKVHPDSRELGLKVQGNWSMFYTHGSRGGCQQPRPPLNSLRAASRGSRSIARDLDSCVCKFEIWCCLRATRRGEPQTVRVNMMSLDIAGFTLK